jgi:tetratricopeptide (TPR) repeat protein
VGAGAGATAGAGGEWSSGSRAQRAAADPTHSAEKSAERFSLHCETALALAELYAQHAGDPELDDAGRLLSDAFDCVYKARELSGGAYLPDIHSTLGRFCLQSGRLVEAARHFESALAVDAHHVDSLVGLATVESRRESGSLVLAYGYLTNALQVDGASHEAWAALGLVLRAQGKEALAAEHLLTALELERTAPAFAFSLVPRFL